MGRFQGGGADVEAVLAAAEPNPYKADDPDEDGGGGISSSFLFYLED